MLDDLTGKVALVTGASRGIGRAIAIALAKAGADIAVNYRSRHKDAKETCDEIKRLGRRSITVEADVSLAADVARLVRTVEAELGPLAILVNNAGVTRPQPIVRTRLWVGSGRLLPAASPLAWERRSDSDFDSEGSGGTDANSYVRCLKPIFIP
jgi:NAD(P)-dependent dehydrogenase (short-subunit alcohol dehydrogenase family)